MKALLFVFLGGGLGSSLRYIMSLVIGKSDGLHFPTSTFIVNILGCFCIGIVAGLMSKYKVNELYALLLITGILGGFTTFSSFALEFVQLWKNNQITLALLYVLFTNFVGITFAAIGLYCLK